MLLSTHVTLRCNGRTLNWYTEKGYSVQVGENFNVAVEDLSSGSTAKVRVQCDYCQKVVTMTYVTYKSKPRTPLDPDACSGCKHHKILATMLETYGRGSINKKLSYDYVQNAFTDRGYILLSTEYDHSLGKLDFMCDKHGPQSIVWNQFNRGLGCDMCCRERMSEKRRGSNGSNWKGGISSLQLHLRAQLTDWKRASSKHCQYKCVITGERMEVIHHIYGFNNILQEVVENCGFSDRVAHTDYTPDELNQLADECRRLHTKYGLGACLTKEMHKFFHTLYGSRDNTPEQFEEFVANQRKIIHD